MAWTLKCIHAEQLMSHCLAPSLWQPDPCASVSHMPGLAVAGRLAYVLIPEVLTSMLVQGNRVLNPAAQASHLESVGRTCSAAPAH